MGERRHNPIGQFGQASGQQAGAVARALAFAKAVEAEFRKLGARTKPEVVLAGQRIDLLVVEGGDGEPEVRTAVEVKAFKKRVASGTVRPFASLGSLLRERGLVDRVLMVSQNGFTTGARELAPSLGIELMDFAELRKAAGRSSAPAETTAPDARSAESTADEEARAARKVFVLMPFAQEFEDVYILGIREVAEKMGLVVERADDIEHNQEILEVIQERTRAADLVIGDITGQNPNVYYEVGYAHASDVPTVLIVQAGEKVPFDLRGKNHISYTSIVDLRGKLETRLRASLGTPSGQPGSAMG